jgi:lambda repressor-like predicted transcriptional regulator
MTDDEQELATTEAKAVKEPRISKRMRKALLLLAKKGMTQRDAAKQVGMSESHLSNYLRKPQVQMFIARAIRETVAVGAIRASARIVELIDAGSEHVSADVSKHTLAIVGVKPSSDPAAQVNINIQAGYVIDLSDDPPAKVIDVTPNPPSERDRH